VHRLLLLPLFAVAGTAGCRVLSSGLPDDDASPAKAWPDAAAADAPRLVDEGSGAVPVEQPGVAGPGCSDGTREGFREYEVWPLIAGCAGGFAQAGVIGTLKPACALVAGDSSNNPAGVGCSAADLCAAGWHVCLDGPDVANHSPTGGCEGSVVAGEPRFFLVAMGASPMGTCTSDRTAANDLHGCGGLGEPESADCQPLNRRMGFADCRKTDRIWFCGSSSGSTEEASVVTKSGPTLGGVLCCKDQKD